VSFLIREANPQVPSNVQSTVMTLGNTSRDMAILNIFSPRRGVESNVPMGLRKIISSTLFTNFSIAAATLGFVGQPWLRG
jgi:hypothetical protein